MMIRSVTIRRIGIIYYKNVRFINIFLALLLLYFTSSSYLSTPEKMKEMNREEYIRSKFIQISDSVVQQELDGIRKKSCNNRPNSEAKEVPKQIKVTSLLNCSQSFVVMKGGGRLGNTICEYISIVVLQKLYKFQAALDPVLHQKMSDIFQVVKIPALPQSGKCPKIYDLQKISMNDLITKLQKGPTRKDANAIAAMVGGRFVVSQCPCLFETLVPHRHLLKDELILSESYRARGGAMLTDILGAKRKEMLDQKLITLVSVHVRRDDFDYILNKYNKDRGFLTSCYFYNAMNVFRRRFKNVVFIVGGTTMDWNKMYLTGDDVVYADRPSEFQPMLDLTILSSFCNHHIISLGTFSFATAYLGGGSSGAGTIVVHPFVVGKSIRLMERAYVCLNNINTIPVPDCAHRDGEVGE